MYGKERKLAELLEPAISALGYELLGVQWLSGGRNKLRLYIDSEQGIGLEDCERASDQASGLLDVYAQINSEYDLEVSSPGFDRPLFKLQHYRQFLGQVAKVQLLAPIEGRRKLTGEIKQVDEESITFEVDGEPFEFPFDAIMSCRLVPSYD